MLDVFRGDGYSMTELTVAINKLPFKPGKLGGMPNLFDKAGIPTLTVNIEERQGRLSILATAPRGTVPTFEQGPTRKLRPFNLLHVPIGDTVVADEVQGVRAFGEEDVMETVNGILNDKMQVMRQDFEVTHEYHRINALHGVILDANGSTTLLNLFTEFGITETEITFDFSNTDIDMKTKSTQVIREMEDALGADNYDTIHAMCGNNFWDNFISHPTVRDRYKDYTFADKNRFGLEQQRSGGFLYNDIMWHNYRGAVGGVNFVATNTCRFFPTGVKNLFIERYGPANFVETVNTKGKPVYIKQSPNKWDTAIDLYGQSNFLIIPTRPSVLIKGTGTGSTSGS